MTILVTVLVLGLLVVVHEAGHFLAARRAGIKVHEFTIGFGPALYRRRVGETYYALRVIPWGAGVRIAGMEAGEADDPEGFSRKPVRTRAGVIFAGPLMNLVLAVALFTFIFAVLGIGRATLTVAQVLPGGPAAGAGLRVGDRILEVDGRRMTSWDQVVAMVQASPGRPLAFTVERGGVRRQAVVVPERSPTDQRVGFVGLAPVVRAERDALPGALWAGVKETYRVTILLIRGVLLAITGKVEARLMGPVGIGELIGQAARMGLRELMYLTAVLSANLALFNLVPIPALDGSRLMFLGLEVVRGKPVDPARENLVHLVGFALLMLLFLVITYMDLARLGA
ncbi:MAG: RIP metalloprotease RseP [Bacillota bacterium]|nr:RIP metalloprotease RseP [Bacillota bacterium]